MFPTGAPGAALFVLRISVAATLVVDGTTHWTLVNSFWHLLGFAALVIFLCVGFLTPYCSVLCCLMLLHVLLVSSGNNQLHLVISVLISGTLGVMGPGAYSVDARIFGRRLITVPPRR
jgi:uncharacterized membrane protein YphA (DoxX/SURF4 family)